MQVSCFRDNRQAYWGHEFDLSGSRDVIDHMTIGFPIGHFLLRVLWNQAYVTVSEIFNGECDAMVDMNLKTSTQRSRSFILVSIDFLYATAYRLSIVTFYSMTHRSATIHNVTDRQTTDGRYIVA